MVHHLTMLLLLSLTVTLRPGCSQTQQGHHHQQLPQLRLGQMHAQAQAQVQALYEVVNTTEVPPSRHSRV